MAYTTPNGDLNVVNSDGTGAHKLASVGGDAFPLSWSPDGSTIRFSRDLNLFGRYRPAVPTFTSCSRIGIPPRRSVAAAGPLTENFSPFSPGLSDPTKFPEAQIYALDERRGLFRPPAKDPIQLTSGPVEWSPPVFSKDGKKIFATGSTKRGELVRLDAKSSQFQPFLGGISADLIAFSKDGHSVAYVTLPGWNFVESKPGWKRPRSTDQSVLISRYRSHGHQTAPNSCSRHRLRKVRMHGSFHPRVAVHSGFFQRTAGRRQSQAGHRTGARFSFPRARSGVTRATYAPSTSPVIR